VRQRKAALSRRREVAETLRERDQQPAGEEQHNDQQRRGQHQYDGR